MSKDPYRYRCPEGHASWRSRDSGLNQAQGNYYCATCQRYGDGGPFDELMDMKNAD